MEKKREREKEKKREREKESKNEEGWRMVNGAKVGLGP